VCYVDDSHFFSGADDGSVTCTSRYNCSLTLIMMSAVLPHNAVHTRDDAVAKCYMLVLCQNS